jgi:hypothetical protein
MTKIRKVNPEADVNFSSSITPGFSEVNLSIISLFSEMILEMSGTLGSKGSP